MARSSRSNAPAASRRTRYWASRLGFGAVVTALDSDRRLPIRFWSVKLLSVSDPKTIEDEPGERRKLSRRRLLAGGVVAAPTLALLHETVPHQGLHTALRGGDAEAEASSMAGHAMHSTDAGHATGGHAAFAAGREVDHAANGFHPTDVLRDFDYGRTTRLASGRVLREWDLVASDKEIEVAPGVKYPAWTYNGRVPGPTLRCREGERLRINFINGSEHPHTMHFHGVHPAFMDGMPGIGEQRGGGAIDPGQRFTLRVRGRALRPASLPLPRLAAGLAHRPRPVRRVRRSTRRRGAPMPTSW